MIKGMYSFFKRLLDIMVSLFGIIVLSWLFIILAILVKVTSKGSIFFIDNRVGKSNKNIKVLKFRTMYYDAESRLKSYLTEEQMEEWTKERKIVNDPRITPIGKMLRKTSLDELPQLFNILIGNLSIVGPRPITRMELEENFTEEEKNKLLTVKPGLTGNWQVYGRSDVSFESGERQKMELDYINKRGFFFDLKIVFLTIPAVLKHRGAK